MSQLFEQAVAGFRSLQLKDSIKEAALANLKQWLEEEAFADYAPQVEDLIRRKQWETLVDCFYQVLPFGTGGQRGPVGIGSNRYNPYNLTSSVQGHVEYLKLQQREKGWDTLSVVVAYDVRQFNDQKGVYNTELPNPCLGLQSRDFARIAAGVYAANGIEVWILPEEVSEVMSTPELSFCIRYLNAQGGLNISASHNPPDDNGAKVYNYTGGQEVPPNDETMVKLVEQVDEVRKMTYQEAKATGRIHFIPPEARRAYIEAILACSLQPACRDATIVFSPLHGAGKYAGARALEEAGFRVVPVKEQWPDDGNFPEAPNGIANPEEPLTMVLAAKLAKKIGADLAMASDPDADRMGAVAPDREGRWHFLDGNQLGVLLAHYILETRQQQGALPEKPLLLTTEVTTSMLRRVAGAFGARIVDHLLVGFKYMGDILRQIEEEGGYEGEPYTLDDFLFATEESHGYLVTAAIRDKDSAGASLLLAELAATCKQNELTVIDYLDTIYEKLGFTRNLLVSVGMSGAEGSNRIRQIQESFRKSIPQSIGGLEVAEMVDLQDEKGRFGPFKSGTDRSARNVLVFKMEGGMRAAIRPSGTEPKTKIYFEASGHPEPGESLAALKTRIDHSLIQFAESFTASMLERGGVEADTPGVKVGGVAELEKKLNFNELL